MLTRALPVMVAVATGFGVAATVFRQPGGYPLRLLASQLVIILACVLIVSRSRITRVIGLLLLGHSGECAIQKLNRRLHFAIQGSNSD